jgi:predicted permease
MSLRMWQRRVVRVWRRRPLLSVGVVVTLAGAIALSVTMAAVLEAVSRRATVFPAAADIVVPRDPSPEPGYEGHTIPVTSYAEWRAASPHYQQLVAYQAGELTVASDVRTELVRAVRFSGDLFEALQVLAAAGRLPGRRDEEQQPCAAVLTTRFATTLSGSASQAIDQSILVDGRACVVVGVVDDRFAFPAPETAVFVLMPPRPEVVRRQDGSINVGVRAVQVFGRVKHGVQRDELQAEAARYFSDDAAVASLEDFLTLPYQRTLELLRTSSLAVLVVGVFNVAVLLGATAVQRLREWALKGALGASRRDLWREALLECLILCVPAALLGMGVAYGVIRALALRGPTELVGAQLSLTTLWAWLGVSVGLAAVASVPAWWQASRSGVHVVLSLVMSGVTAAGAPLLARRVMPAILVVQVCVSIVLVAVSLTFADALHRILTADRGFAADDAVVVPTFQVTGAPLAVYLAELTAIQRELSARPGTVASLAVDLPVPHIARAVSLWGDEDSRGIMVYREGAPYRLALVGAQYFHVLRTPMLVGRDFTDADTAGSPPVVVVSRSFAEHEFGSATAALGQRWDPGSRLLSGPATIVGVAADVTRSQWDTRGPAVVYANIGQVTPAAAASQPALARTIVIVRGLPRSLISDVIREYASRLHTGTIWTVWDARRQEVASTLVYVAAAGAFAGVTLLLIAVGVFAVTAEHMHRRRPEMAVRQAVGASPLRAASHVARSLARWWILATVLGAMSAAWVSRTVIVGEPVDTRVVWIVAASVLVVTAAMGLAVIGPARRAVAIQPAQLLRHD